MIAQRKWWIVVVLLCGLAIFSWFFFFPNNQARAKAERFRRALHKEGFKTEVSQFSIRVPPDVRERSEKILVAGLETRDVLPFRSQGFFQPVGSNAAVILSAQDALKTEYSTNEWAGLRHGFDAHRDALDGACAAVMSGPVRFDADFDPSPDRPIQYLATLRALAGALAVRTLCELHDGRYAETWTNLLALTRMATAWDTEPWELAHMMKFNFAVSAARLTWDAQHRHALNRVQLAALGNEWRHMRIFEDLPATAELSCAMTLQACEAQRAQPPNPTVPVRRAIGDFFDSPSRGWSEMTSGWRQSRYRNFGSYEDELDAMRFYSARQHSLREALNKKAWVEIRALADITNTPAFQGVALPSGSGGGGRGSGQGFFSRQRSLALRAAEAEARRRLVLAALALEMFYLDHKEYPRSLGELTPPASVPADFMDGKPLRYRRISPANFLLYSTGPDCADDGGITLWEGRFNGRGFFRSEEPDMIWPRAASEEEILAQASEPQPERRRGR